MQEMDVTAEVGVCEGALSDLKYLVQNIREDFFDIYDKDLSKEDKLFLANDVSRFAALFRILDIHLCDIHKRVKKLDTHLMEQAKERKC